MHCCWPYVPPSLDPLTHSPSILVPIIKEEQSHDALALALTLTRSLAGLAAAATPAVGGVRVSEALGVSGVDLQQRQGWRAAPGLLALEAAQAEQGERFCGLNGQQRARRHRRGGGVRAQEVPALQGPDRLLQPDEVGIACALPHDTISMQKPLKCAEPGFHSHAGFPAGGGRHDS